MSDRPLVVAVINTSPDIVDMLRLVLEQAGIIVVSALTWEIREGSIDLEPLMTQHDPRVIVYDIAPPYEANWRLFEHMTTLPIMRGRQFVLTTTNVQQLEKVAKPHQTV